MQTRLSSTDVVLLLLYFNCFHSIVFASPWFFREQDDNVSSRNETANPDINLRAPEIIARHGYPSETHLVKTKDEYIIAIHRIPYGKNLNPEKQRQPVILQHGFIESSADFVITNKKSLAFTLANSGYDVWMPNSRGNTYSREHMKYTTSDKEYWNFSWEEMAKYDLPAVIDYVCETTNQTGNVLFVGHSMGTTILFALLADQPEYNNKIKAMFALAPVATIKTIKSPLGYLSSYVPYFESVTDMVGQYELLPNSVIFKYLTKYVCKRLELSDLCQSTIFIFSGYDKEQMDPDIIPVILSHSPAGSSVKTLIHFAQQILSHGRFQHYDYGSEGNLEKYGQSVPPEYNLSNVKIPVAIFYGDNDWLSVKQDVEVLYSKLPNTIELYRVPFKKFNHIDFIWAKDAPKLLYKHLLKLMETV